MSQLPERVFRIGMITASVFARKIERAGEADRVVRSVSIQKRYLDNGETKFSSSFGLNELPQALECMRLSMHYLARVEAEIVGGDDSSQVSS